MNPRGGNSVGRYSGLRWAASEESHGHHRDAEICVCYFVEVLGTNHPKISRHLAYLRRAGLVSARKEGKWVHYRVAEPSEPNAARILREVLTWLKDDPEMRRDRERLVKVCCAPQPPVSIQGAPRPAGVTA